MTTTAILTGAGSGSRLGAAVPKALVPINGRPMVVIAAQNLLASGVIDQLIVTVPNGFMEQFEAELEGIGQPLTLVVGGLTRQHSIANALQHLKPSCSKVLVHDAARPFAPPSLIATVAAAITPQTPAIIPGLPVTDTIKVVNDANTVTSTLDRSMLRAVQTPQGFEKDLLLSAYQNALRQKLDATDDAGIVSELSTIRVIPGDEAAMKITTPTDLKIATLLYGDKV